MGSDKVPSAGAYFNFSKAFSQQDRREDDMAAGSVESRLSNIEELVIIIIIWVIGGRPGPRPPPGDSIASDISRVEALRRFVHGIPDPFASDITRLPLEAVESRLLEVNAEMTRLRSHEAELNARLKELRGNKTK